VPIELPAHGGGGRGQRLSPAPALVSGLFQGRQLGPACRLWSQAAMTVPRLVMSAATMTPNALLCRPGPGGVAVRRRGTASGASCSPFAHRRCAYSWTSQHTSVAGMQVRRTTLDASVPRGTGWPGSNPTSPDAEHPAPTPKRAAGFRGRPLGYHHAGDQGQPVYTGGCPWPRPRQGSPSKAVAMAGLACRRQPAGVCLARQGP
jgi:hypothetical protein